MYFKGFIQKIYKINTYLIGELHNSCRATVRRMQAGSWALKCRMQALPVTNCSIPACSPVLQKQSVLSTLRNRTEKPWCCWAHNTCQTSPHPPRAGYAKELLPPVAPQQEQWFQEISRISRKEWHNVLSPTYKQRNEDIRKFFKQLPDTECFIVNYSCALQTHIYFRPILPLWKLDLPLE